MKTLKEVGNLVSGKTYRLHIPARKFPEVEFNATIKDYKVVDKENNLGKMSAYQIEMSCQDKYYCYEDELGRVALFEVKPDYLIEEI